MILCYQLETGADACGLARGTKPLHVEGVSRMTPHLEHVSCPICISAVELMVI